MIRYFLKYNYYVFIGVIFAGLLSFLIGEFKWELIPVANCNIFLLRLLDDCFDFKKDKRKKILDLKQLIYITAIISVVYFAICVSFFKQWGLFSLLMLLYMVVENKHELLKLFFLSVVSAFYIGAYRDLNSIAIVVYLIVAMMASVAFYLYKKRRLIKEKGKQK